MITRYDTTNEEDVIRPDPKGWVVKYEDHKNERDALEEFIRAILRSPNWSVEYFLSNLDKPIVETQQQPTIAFVGRTIPATMCGMPYCYSCESYHEPGHCLSKR